MYVVDTILVVRDWLLLQGAKVTKSVESLVDCCQSFDPVHDVYMCMAYPTNYM